MHKTIGPWGVFATTDATGMALALPNADAPSRSAPPYPGGQDAQNTAVKDYFIGAGLQSNQIDAVKTNSIMAASGNGTEAANPPTLQGSYSYITRQYAGIPIVDSYAWARMDNAGDVVTESVYWPEIPAGVLAEATAFAQNLASPSWEATFAQRLPAPHQGKLVIHHTPGTWKGTFAANVAYDVPVGGGRVMHFDPKGASFDLPEEVPGAWGNAPSMSK